MESFSEINGIVQQNQRPCFTHLPVYIILFANLFHFSRHFFSLYLPLFFTLSAILFQETRQKDFPPSPGASHSTPKPVPPEIRMNHRPFMDIHAHYI